MRKVLKKFYRGFTLIEMLIVLVILSLLMTGFMMVISTQLKKARDGRRKVDLELIKTVLYEYSFDNGCFPQNLPSCGQSLGSGENIYLKNFPCDPKNGMYFYQTEEVDCPGWFKVFAQLENTKDSGIDKVGCLNGCGPDCEYNYGVKSTNVLLGENCPIIVPTAAPSMTISPTVPPRIFACTPSGNCLEFIDPVLSRCPITFENDPTCLNLCKIKDNRCHDERGKKN